CAGLVIGLTSAFYRGFVDLILMRVVDIVFAFPLLVLAILIVGLLGPSRRNAMIAIGIVYAPAFIRVIRAAALEVLGFPFIESARSLGANDVRIMTRHVLPNIVAPVIVLTTVYFSQAILGEAFLSFLGLGTQPPEAAWGNMLSSARNFIESSVWMSVFPGLAIMFAVLGFNFLGDGLRDVLDPRLGGVVDELVGAPARTTIDAGGRIVCPGFVDPHSHSDWSLLANPTAESTIRQGVTTEVVGNCGWT